MTRKERRWCWFFSAALLMLTSLPYAIGLLQGDNAWVFSGFVFGVEDGNSYIAKMLSGTFGAWLFRTPYTGAEQRGVLGFLPYLVLGKLAQPPNLHTKLVVLFHALRLAAIPYLLFSIYRFTGLFLSSSDARRWVTFLAASGGGLGWLLPVFGRSTLLDSLPLEFYSPETFGFLAILGLPHLVFARALLLDALRHYLDPEDKTRTGLLAGLLISLILLFQPMTAVIALVVVGAHVVAIALRAGICREGSPLIAYLRRATITAILPLPLLALYAYSFLRDPFLATWTAQNLLASPHPLLYALAYGVLIPLAFIGGKRLLREGGAGYLPLAWVVLLPVLVYAPVTVQRRLPEGIWVALLIISAVGLQEIRHAPRWSTLFTILLLPSSMLLLVGSLQAVRVPEEPVYHDADLVKSFQWLRDNVEVDSLVLTSYRSGNILPAYAPMRVVIGHGPESVNLAVLQPQVAWFYEGGFEESTCAWLEEQEIDVVYWGPYEREFGDEGVAPVGCLEVMYAEGDIRVYEVLVP